MISRSVSKKGYFYLRWRQLYIWVEKWRRKRVDKDGLERGWLKVSKLDQMSDSLGTML